jgi:hypothetical protein
LSDQAPPTLDQRLRGDLDALQEFAAELSRLESGTVRALPGDNALPERINVDEANVEQGLAKLVLTLIDLLRRLLEKQAIRRMETGTLTDEQIERMGETFLELERRMAELKAAFGLADEELDLRLGPLGNLIGES